MLRPGETIRQRRLGHGLTQRQLAIRAGSTQAAISRLERGEISPTFETFERLLFVMGDEAQIMVDRTESDHHRARLAGLKARSPEERFQLAIGWNRLAGEFARAGVRARAKES